MDEYVRYGEEWEQEMMRNKKEDIVRMFSEAMKEKEEYAEQKCKTEKAKLINCIPDTWLDPLLTGEGKVIVSPYDEQDIERLLHGIKKRMMEKLATDK